MDYFDSEDFKVWLELAKKEYQGQRAAPPLNYNEIYSAINQAATSEPLVSNGKPCG